MSKEENKHTPGPWIAKPDGQGTYSVVENRVEMWLDEFDIGIATPVVDVAGTVMSVTPAMNPIAFGPIDRADAYLIAAAPDMDLVLNAIRFGVVTVNPTRVESFHFGDKIAYPHTAGWSGVAHAFGRDDLRAAIAKATGESK